MSSYLINIKVKLTYDMAIELSQCSKPMFDNIEIYWKNEHFRKNYDIV
jgi:hypothetical protein